MPRRRQVAASRLKMSAEEGGPLARRSLRRSWHPLLSLIFSRLGGRGGAVLLRGDLGALLVAKSRYCTEEVQDGLIGRRLRAIWC